MNATPAAGSQSDRCAAGFPANFFLVNPDCKAAPLHRQRRQHPVQLAAGGVAPAALATDFSSRQLRWPRSWNRRACRSARRSWKAGENDVRTRLEVQLGLRAAVWPRPALRGSVTGWLDQLISGWEIQRRGKVLSGRPLDFGNIDGRDVHRGTAGRLQPAVRRPDRKSTFCRRTSSTTRSGRSTRVPRRRRVTAPWVRRRDDTSRRPTERTVFRSCRATAPRGTTM